MNSYNFVVHVIGSTPRMNFELIGRKKHNNNRKIYTTTRDQQQTEFLSTKKDFKN